jgi:hypothetical protein
LARRHFCGADGRGYLSGRHARLIELCRAEPTIRAAPLTSEEEGLKGRATSSGQANRYRL